jgi:hypothetical protein
MLYPLTIQAIANEQLEETRRRAEHAVRVREARARTRAEGRRARASRASRTTRRFPRLVTLRVAGLATRSPR